MYNDYLIHHGTKGMKWGVRRYQNKDGTYTNLGRSRRKELSRGVKISAAAGLAGGAIAGVVGFALSTTNPAFLTTAAATYIGKAAITGSLNSSTQFLVKELAQSKSVDAGKKMIYGSRSS